MSNEQYGVEQIAVLSQLEHVRLRPAMYIGTVSDARGPAQMAFEIIDNAVDEHEAGHGDRISVTVDPDFTVTVVDHGRGIPVGPHPTAVDADGAPVDTLTLALTTLNAGGKFKNDDESGYSVGVIGMHGVGSSVVQMLSDRFEVTVRRDGGVFHQTFSRGVPTSPVVRVGDLDDPADTGTVVVYHPDPEIFKQTMNPGERLPARLNELASLNPGLTIDFTVDGQTTVFHYDDGLAGLVVRDLGERMKLFDAPIAVHGSFDAGPEQGQIRVDAAFIYDDDPEPGSTLRCFANNVSTGEGGTHKLGLRQALRTAVNERILAQKLAKAPLEVRFIEDGLHGAISVKLRNPEMEGQTKEKLGNKVAQTAVEAVVGQELAKLVAAQPAVATALDAVAARAVRTREAEEAARRARSVARSTKAVAKAERLPSKLAECVWPVGSYRELVVVEGNSAAGCMAADTRVPLVDGRTVTVAQLVEEHAAGKVNHVYSVSPEGNLTAQPVLNAWETKRVSRLAEVTLDNGEVVRCTVDHPFMLRDGTYAPAETLTPGTSLMPLYTRTSASSVVVEDEGDLYRWALNPRDERWTPVAKLVAEQYMGPRPRTGVHIHHVDRNGLNNSPENLVYMDAAEHLAMHNRARDASRLVAAHRRRMREDPEYFERTWRRLHSPEAHAKIAEGQRRRMADPANREHLAAKAHEEWADPELRAWRAETTRTQMAAQAQRPDYAEWTARRCAAAGAAKHLNAERRVLAFTDWLAAQGRTGVFADFGDADVRAQFCAQTGADFAPSTAIIYRCLHEAGPDVRSLSTWAEWRRAQSPPVNHKVAGVRLVDLPEPVPVYDLEVPPYANFALAAGVFVHNSAKEGRFKEFQAILPLRGKILNVSKADLERALSSETIRTLIVSIGTGIGKEFNIKGLRYSKIVIMTDADVDLRSQSLGDKWLQIA